VYIPTVPKEKVANTSKRRELTFLLHPYKSKYNYMKTQIGHFPVPVSVLVNCMHANRSYFKGWNVIVFENVSASTLPHPGRKAQ
jgi:hypothetical protein